MDSVYLTSSLQFASPVAVAQVFNEEGPLVQDACREPGWWDVQIWGYGSEQVVPALTTAVAPDQGFLKSQQRSIPIRARLRYEGDVVDFDIGAGMRLAVYARSISLSAVAPTGSVLVQTQGQATLVNPAPIAPIQEQDSLVYGQIARVEAPIGQRLAKLTQSVAVAAAGTVNIPSRARTVQVYQGTAGGAPTPLNWQTNIASAVDLGQIDFRAIVQPNSTDIMAVPGRATIVAHGAQVRTLTFVWGLEL